MATIATIEDIAPQRIKMSYEEYLNFASDTQLVEWDEGEGIIYMPPIPEHQNISYFLSTLIGLFIRFFDLGNLHYAPLEVQLWPGGPSREPDIFFAVKENVARLTDRRFEGAPDLIIEIISPSSVTEDRVRKFNQYEQAGVKEYWLIDPRPHQQQADFYILGEDKLFSAAPLDDAGRFQSSVLPNFWFNLDWLWQNPLPNPQLILAEIMISIESLSPEAKAVYQALYNLLRHRHFE